MARRTRVFARGSQRHTDWGASVPAGSFLSVGGATVTLLETFVPNAGGETLIRTRGMLSFGSDQFVAGEQQLGSFGIGVVSAQAEALGITAIPHPGDDAAWGGWLYHTFLFNRFNFSSAVSTQAIATVNIVIDSKAMRKVSDEERLVVVLQNSGSNGMTFTHSIRVLSKNF